MPWFVATLLSAFFLGLYDLSTKHAVRGNAVLPVLFLANVCSAAIWGTLLLAQRLSPGAVPAGLVVQPLSLVEHLMLLAKSLIVAASWTSGYFAVKHLPVSLASPIRATGPVWTLCGALLLLGERPSVLEGVGVVITIASFVLLSFAGRSEGITFHRDPWVGWLLLATLLGACSGLYDKVLLGRLGFTAATVQAWFVIYLVFIFGPLALGWKLRWWPRQEFHWRWSILGVSLALLVADFLYFGALRHPEALVSLVASLRRGSVLVAFAGGILLFREQNARGKLPAVAGILAGITLTLLG